MKGVVYKYTFPNGKVYIGQTRRNPELRHKEHLDAVTGPCNCGFWKEYKKYKEVKYEMCELHLEDIGRTILSKDLLPYIYGITEKILSQSDVEKIYNRLESKNITSESTRRHHIAYVQRVKSKG